MGFKSITGAMCACLAVVSFNVSAAIVTYDADDYPVYSDASNSLPGVTLTAVGTYPRLTGDVVIAQKPGTVGSMYSVIRKTMASLEADTSK